ncbi:hypothetical protein [Polaribacter atrinae]|uniref:hypothetical protein n=1 Tax=Polaribacter atrinae TaxID=1333662 RepID=UPI002492E751|nr:hypothetical protein [Polaribacter atrinae]
MEVLLYQIGIFLAILIAGKLGEKSRITAIVLICIFTILQVYMSWLLILQFITIIFSYIISKKIFSTEIKENISSKKENLNLESIKEKLKKELEEKSPIEKKKKIIKKIKNIEKTEKKDAIKKVEKNPTYISKKITPEVRKNLYTVEEIHSLNGLSTEPKTQEKLSALRRNYPKYNILMIDNIRKVLKIDSDIKIIEKNIYISPEIVYQPELLAQKLEKSYKDTGITTFKKNAGKKQINNRKSPELQQKLINQVVNKKIILKKSLNKKLKEGQTGKIIDVFDTNCFAVEFYNGKKIITVNNESIFFIGIMDFSPVK